MYDLMPMLCEDDWVLVELQDATSMRWIRTACLVLARWSAVQQLQRRS